MNIPEEAIQAAVRAVKDGNWAEWITIEAAARRAVEAAAPLIAAQVLRDAYWKLREHASALRGTDVYRKASERREGTLGESPAYQRYRWLEATARGIESAARDIVDLLDVEEYEVGDRERSLMGGDRPDGFYPPGELGAELFVIVPCDRADPHNQHYHGTPVAHQCPGVPLAAGSP